MIGPQKELLLQVSMYCKTFSAAEMQFNGVGVSVKAEVTDVEATSSRKHSATLPRPLLRSLHKYFWVVVRQHRPTSILAYELGLPSYNCSKTEDGWSSHHFYHTGLMCRLGTWLI